MTIIEALRQAETDHVIYFLLTAYAESLGWYDRPGSCFPTEVTRLPVAGAEDVSERVSALRHAGRAHPHGPSRARMLLDEALAVFDAASQRLQFLASRHVRAGRPERVREAHALPPAT